MTTQLIIALIRKLHGSLMCLSYFVFSSGVSATMYWQMSVRPVQELYVCTVSVAYISSDKWKHGNKNTIL